MWRHERPDAPSQGDDAGAAPPAAGLRAPSRDGERCSAERKGSDAWLPCHTGSINDHERQRSASVRGFPPQESAARWNGSRPEQLTQTAQPDVSESQDNMVSPIRSKWVEYTSWEQFQHMEHTESQNLVGNQDPSDDQPRVWRSYRTWEQFKAAQGPPLKQPVVYRLDAGESEAESAGGWDSQDRESHGARADPRSAAG